MRLALALASASGGREGMGEWANGRMGEWAKAIEPRGRPVYSEADRRRNGSMVLATATGGMFAFLALTAFFAGLVDSMAGGGGLVSLPALLAAGVPPHFALGTNKVQSCLGTTFSTARYLRHGQVHVPMPGGSSGFTTGSGLHEFATMCWRPPPAW